MTQAWILSAGSVCHVLEFQCWAELQGLKMIRILLFMCAMPFFHAFWFMHGVFMQNLFVFNECYFKILARELPTMNFPWNLHSWLSFKWVLHCDASNDSFTFSNEFCIFFPAKLTILFRWLRSEKKILAICYCPPAFMDAVLTVTEWKFQMQKLLLFIACCNLFKIYVNWWEFVYRPFQASLFVIFQSNLLVSFMHRISNHYQRKTTKNLNWEIWRWNTCLLYGRVRFACSIVDTTLKYPLRNLISIWNVGRG